MHVFLNFIFYFFCAALRLPGILQADPTVYVTRVGIQNNLQGGELGGRQPPH